MTSSAASSRSPAPTASRSPRVTSHERPLPATEQKQPLSRPVAAQAPSQNDVMSSPKVQHVLRLDAVEKQIEDMVQKNAPKGDIVKAIRDKASFEDLVEIIAFHAAVKQEGEKEMYRRSDEASTMQGIPPKEARQIIQQAETAAIEQEKPSARATQAVSSVVPKLNGKLVDRPGTVSAESKPLAVEPALEALNRAMVGVATSDPRDKGRAIVAFHKAVVDVATSEYGATAEQPAPATATAPQAVITASGFRETPQHTAIFKAMADDGRGAIVEAVAGSGKSTTIVEGARRVLSNPNERRTFRFMVFNKAIAEDLSKKLSSGNASATTFHSMAWGLVRSARNWNSNSYIKDGRVQDAAFHVAKYEIGGKKVGQDSKDLKQVWSLALATMTPMDQPGQLKLMAKEFGASVDQKSPIFNVVSAMDKRLRSDRSSTSFDEMLREVVEEGLRPPRADIVVVDEAQDLNLIQIEMLKRMNPAKVIAVGDRKQAIYAFRGADSRAMDRLSDAFGITDQLPLSVTHRCAKNIVREAQQLVPTIQPKEDAPDGLVDHRALSRLRETILRTEPGDLVIGRNNKPLVDAFFDRRSVGDGAEVAIVGSDAGKEMKALINRANKATGSTDPMDLAQFIADSSEERASRIESGGSSAAAENIRDEAATTNRILSQVDSMQDANELIDKMFVATPTKGAINFTTVHRSKGLEAERVVFLGPNLLPSRKAVESKSQALIEQENNLLYVGITRARTELVMQEMPDQSPAKKR